MYPQMQPPFKLIGLACIALVLGGCETTATQGERGEQAPVVEPSPAGGDTSAGGGATTQGLDTTGTGSWQGDPLENPDSLLYTKVIYFEFDRTEIRDEDKPILEAHANYLAAHPSASVTLAGHADERGTREYNLGLGERRAQGVRRFVNLFGASGQQTRTISYGEERPAADGHGEDAWRMNRRVEIIYRSR